MICLLAAIGLTTRRQYYSTHLHTNSTQNNTMKQITRNGTYLTIRIHKHNSEKTRNLQNQTKAYKTHNHMYNDKNMEPKG